MHFIHINLGSLFFFFYNFIIIINNLGFFKIDEVFAKFLGWVLFK